MDTNKKEVKVYLFAYYIVPYIKEPGLQPNISTAGKYSQQSIKIQS